MTVDALGSARPFFGKAPAYVTNKDDQARVQAYELYENIWRINPNTYKLMQRGADAAPIYLPSPKKCISTISRFLEVDWDFLVSPKVGTTQDQATVQALLNKIWKREKMHAKFATQKSMGLVRGDKLWHVVADPTKPAGSRISIYALSPASYFPILLDNNPDRVIGCHIVDVIVDPNDPNKTKEVARRQTYLKDVATGVITSSLKLFEVNAWDDRNLEPNELKQVGVLTPDFQLPPLITSIPVYHTKNGDSGPAGFGLSELSGYERVYAAVNQAISDEELTLAVQGLGLYTSTAGPPQTESGDEGEWELGPGQVVELPSAEDKFERISGVTTVAPMLDHIRFIMGEIMSSMGLSNVATGDVDTATAESGIALALKLAPLLAKNAEKEAEDLGVTDQLLYDLTRMWLPAYEQLSPEVAAATEVVSVVGDPMPQNRAADVAEVVSLATSVPPLITVAEARTRLIQLGWDLETDESGQATTDALITEQQKLAEARSYDPFVNRFNSELDNALDQPSGSNATTGV